MGRKNGIGIIPRNILLGNETFFDFPNPSFSSDLRLF